MHYQSSVSDHCHYATSERVSPETRLLWALLVNAAIELRGSDSTVTRAMRRETLLWLESPSLEPFAFRWVCLHLRIAPEPLASRLMRLLEAGDRRKFRISRGRHV
jgi:hypothetical protein